MSTIQERVARGAAWLDETRPGWRDAVKLDELRMADGCRCICGQVFAEEAEASRQPFQIMRGGYHYAVWKFGGYSYDDWAESHGFTYAYAARPEPPPSDLAPEPEWDAYYARVQELWVELEDEWRRVIHQPAPTPIRSLAVA